MKQEILQKIEKYVKQEMLKLCSAHDFQHIQRVVANAKKIHVGEKQGDIFVIEAGALLHESFDEKFFEKGGIGEKKNELITFLENTGVEKNDIDKIIFIAENVGYGKSLEREENFIGSIEFQIVEDADRLEAIGAITIARTFAYGAKKGREIYNPNILPLDMKNTADYYSNHESTSFNHFYEKLLLLIDLMHTKTGLEIAKPRHEFMKLYMKEFLAEWNGEK